MENRGSIFGVPRAMLSRDISRQHHREFLCATGRVIMMERVRKGDSGRNAVFLKVLRSLTKPIQELL